ncbi:Leucyl aminopeptidase yscIV [Rhizophlyctis rosea]|nr:Leucyl aminopeptidase yscIV [Rhizophlyctis rosea]
MRGKIALIARGNCEFTNKASLAGMLGASAALIYNTPDYADPDDVLAASVSSSSISIPVAGLSYDQGSDLLNQTSTSNDTEVTLKVQSISEYRTTSNVIAQTHTGDPNNIVMIGAHSDSVPAGPGINDNGSGIITLIELMKTVGKYTTHNAIRFAWWSAEEFGMIGSWNYVDSLSPDELAKIKLYINLDMVASPNYVISTTDFDGSTVTPVGETPATGVIENKFNEYFQSIGQAAVSYSFGGWTDYVPFTFRGIPSGDVFSGASDIKTDEEAKLFGGTVGVAHDKNYHQAGDTFENLNTTAWMICARAAAHVLAESARSLDFLNATTAVSEDGLEAARLWNKIARMTEGNMA